VPPDLPVTAAGHADGNRTEQLLPGSSRSRRDAIEIWTEIGESVARAGVRKLGV